MRVGIAADHEGYELKEQLLASLRRLHFDARDYGDFSMRPEDDYPDYVIPLARAVASAEIDRGIAICGSGVGVCVAANKVKKIRAGLIHDLFSARRGVEDDDMNIICLGSHVMSFPLALELVQCFLEARFSAEPRHIRRLKKISKLEEMEM